MRLLRITKNIHPLKKCAHDCKDLSHRVSLLDYFVDTYTDANEVASTVHDSVKIVLSLDDFSEYSPEVKEGLTKPIADALLHCGTLQFRAAIPEEIEGFRMTLLFPQRADLLLKELKKPFAFREHERLVIARDVHSEYCGLRCVRHTSILESFATLFAGADEDAGTLLDSVKAILTLDRFSNFSKAKLYPIALPLTNALLELGTIKI